jgi:hypothetical protein
MSEKQERQQRNTRDTQPIKRTLRERRVLDERCAAVARWIEDEGQDEPACRGID